MNERTKELARQAGFDPAALERMGVMPNADKFVELMVQDTVDILRQEWYDWNNYTAVEGESPRDVGLRVGAKSQTVRLMHMIKKHFGVE